MHDLRGSPFLFFNSVTHVSLSVLRKMNLELLENIITDDNSHVGINFAASRLERIDITNRRWSLHTLKIVRHIQRTRYNIETVK
jgi:hypothetical protein